MFICVCVCMRVCACVCVCAYVLAFVCIHVQCIVTHACPYPHSQTQLHNKHTATITSYIQYFNVTKVYMRSVLLLLGANDTTELDAAINDIFELERTLAEVRVLVTEFIRCYN